MFNSPMPSADDLPTSRQLLRSTLIALGVALLLLVTVVMPAEYAVDPTGVGRVLGLTRMGEVKQAIAQENAETDTVAREGAKPMSAKERVAVAAADSPSAASLSVSARQDEMSITLQPGQGAEVKLEMKKDARVAFHWFVDGGVVNYDTHGDPYDAPKDFYYGYGKGKQVPEQKGDLTAAFDGKHGWFWRNRSDAPVTVTLRVNGDYIDIKRVI